jgi:hypothetical protein
VSSWTPRQPEGDDGPLDTAPLVRWQRLLVWFMRLTALAWIAKGLFAWLTIMSAASGFDVRPLGFQASVIYFAVIDLVAAVGLWLTSPWGGVLWLLAVMSHLILGLFFPQLVEIPIWLFATEIVLVFVYFGLSWMAAREEG